MTFTKKTLQTHTTGMSFIKGASLFFLGMSCVLFATQAFDIVPSATNVKQYIQEILLTTNGLSAGTQKISLDGATGNGSFSGTVSASIINGTNITGTNICLGGVCKTARPTAGGASVWSTGTNKIYYTGGNVGIGTTGPQSKLHVNGGIRGLNDLIISDDDVTFGKIHTNGLTASLLLNTEENNFSIINNTSVGSDVRLRSDSLFPMLFGTNNTEKMRIDSTGNVGIGTIPTEKLHVVGTGKFTQGVNIGNGILQSTTGIQLYTNTNIQALVISGNGNIGIGTSSPKARLDVKGTVYLLSDLTGGSIGLTGTRAIFFPQSIASGVLNTGFSTDSIWYISCKNSAYSSTGFIRMEGINRSNTNIVSNVGPQHVTGSYLITNYVKSFTYNLTAGATFKVISSCDEGIYVYMQTYGNQPNRNGIIAGGALDADDFVPVDGFQGI